MAAGGEESVGEEGVEGVEGEVVGVEAVRSRGLYSISSGANEFLSVEKGVLSSGSGSR